MLNTKVAERYTDLLTDIIDKKVRVDGRDVMFNREYIISVMNRDQFEDTQISDKMFKDTIKWFKERHILTTEGNTSNLRYKLHPNFKFKLSQLRETVKRQCQFIIGQLMLFSNTIYDDSESLYVEVLKSETIFQFLPTIQSKIVRDTVSSLILHNHNKDNDGVYPYEILQTLLTTKTPFNITIKNKSINSTLKGVTLKKVVYNTDTVSVTFNNSSFELESLNNIKKIEIPLPIDIYDRINKSLDYLKDKNKDKSIDKLVLFLREFKAANEIFFQNILEETK